MKFNHKIVLTCSLVLFISISAISALQYFQVKKNVAITINSNVKALTKSLKAIVEKDIAEKISIATYTGKLVDANPHREFIKEMINKPELVGKFKLIIFGFENGADFVTGPSSWAAPNGFQPKNRSWYKQAVENGITPIVTEPYPDVATGEVTISIAIASKNENRDKLIGVSLFDVDLDKLNNEIDAIDFNKSGFAFLVDKNGALISHPNIMGNYENMSEFLGSLSIKPTTQFINVNKKRSMVSFIKLDSQDWYIGVVIDEEKAFACVEKLKDISILLTAISLFISTSIIIFLLKLLMKPLFVLDKAMREVASGDGDLTKDLSTNTDPEFAGLATNFNLFIEKIRSMILETKQLSSDIKISTEQNCEGSELSVRDISRQESEIEQLATAMDEMSTTASDVASNAQTAATAATTADDAVEEGVKVVVETSSCINSLSTQITQAVKVVNELSESTSNIESILSVITGISDQTNLLALNAAIEAARAGDKGRGFAVVADEVRTLAKRTQESTTEIKNMIDQLQTGAQQAGEAMSKSHDLTNETVITSNMASEALRKIKQSIIEISDMNNQIASAAEEQSLVAQEINENTVNIKDLSSEVSSRVSLGAKNMEEQVSKVNLQNKILNRFKI